jgi:hypothetical protein
MLNLAVVLLQAQTPEQDLTLNWVIFFVLLGIAAILGFIVVKRRMHEQDDDYDI